MGEGQPNIGVNQQEVPPNIPLPEAFQKHTTQVPTEISNESYSISKITQQQKTQNTWWKFVAIGLLIVIISSVSYSVWFAGNNQHADSPPVSDIPPDFIKYTDPAKYFSVSFPPEWELFPSGLSLLPIKKDFFAYYNPILGFDGYVFILSAGTGSPGANLNIVVQHISDIADKGWVTLEEIVEGKQKRTAEIELHYHEYSRTLTVIDGTEAIIIEWGSLESTQVLRCIQVFMVVDQLIWKVTFYIPETQASLFKEDIYNIIGSLRIL